MATSRRLTGAGSAGPRSHGAERSERAQRIDLEELGLLEGRITALEEQKDPGRRSLYLDGRYLLGLDLETVVRCGFKVGLPVDGAALVRAYELDQQKRAWDYALGLLAATARTRREVERRLAAKFSPEVAALAIDRLVNGGWLDDQAYAESYIRSRREYGTRRILADLSRKGVDREVAARAVEALLGEVDAAEQARESAASRLARMGAVDRPTAYRRLAGYLARRGFGPDVISRALGPVLEGLPAGAERRGTGFGRRTSEIEKTAQRAPWGEGSSLRRSGSLQRRRSAWPNRRPVAEEEQE